MMRKIIVRIFMIAALVVLFAVPYPERAEAASSGVTLGGTELVNDGAWHSFNDSGYGISGWTSGRYALSGSGNALYIDGLTYSGSANEGYGIVSDHSLTIIATGSNSIVSAQEAILISDIDNSSRFGELTLAGGTNSSPTIKLMSKAYAICADDCTVNAVNVRSTSGGGSEGGSIFLEGDLNMSSGTVEAPYIVADAYKVTTGTIRAASYILANDNTKASVISDGLLLADNDMTFNGLLEIKGGSVTSGSLYCPGGITQTAGMLITTKGDLLIPYKNYTGSGGTLTVKGAIHVMDGNMLISGTNARVSDGIVSVSGDLKVTDGYLAADKYGIYVEHNVNVSGSGSITAGIEDIDASGAYTSTAALYIEGKLISDGGKITATSDSVTKCAIHVNGETIVNSGTVTAIINNTNNDYTAAAFGGQVYLQGGTFSATGNTKASGIICTQGLQVNNSAVLNADGGGGAYALSVNSEFRLNSGTVTLNGGTNASLYAETVVMQGGKLTMSGKTEAWHVLDKVSLAEDIWMSEPSDGSIGIGGSNPIYTKTFDNASRAVLQKVSSISVQTAPPKVLYVGDAVYPYDLVISVKFADGSSAPLSYDTHVKMIGLSPSESEPLGAGTHNIQVTAFGKSTSFDVVVKEMGKTELSGAPSAGSHKLSWTVAYGAEVYELYGKKEGASSYSLLSDIYSAGFNNTGLAPGERWEYYVVPVRGTNLEAVYRGAESNHVILTAAPDAPVIRMSGGTYDSLSLEWDKVSGADSYHIYRSEGNGYSAIGSVTGTSFTDTGLITGKRYYYYVRAVITSDETFSDNSNTVRGTPEFTGRSTLTVTNTGSYELSWTEVPGATGYELRRGSGADGSRSLIASTDQTYWRDDTADIYTVYNYTVVPVRTTAAGDYYGEESNVAVTEASVKPEPEIIPPDKDEPAGTTFNLLQARSGKVTKASIQIKWRKVPGAVKYIVYGNKCGARNKYKKLLTTTATSEAFTKVAGRKVAKGTYFKFLVYAVDGNGEIISVSKTVHVATKGGKVGNDKSVKTAAKKNRVTLRKGKSFNLKARSIPESKKLKVKRHRKIAYETSNNKVAKVTSKGVIKAVGKGTCYVYAYTQNGVFAKVKVTVK